MLIKSLFEGFVCKGFSLWSPGDVSIARSVRIYSGTALGNSGKIACGPKLTLLWEMILFSGLIRLISLLISIVGPTRDDVVWRRVVLSVVPARVVSLFRIEAG